MSPPLKIAVNTLFLVPGDVGGSETYLRQSLRALAALPSPPSLLVLTNAENDALLRADLASFPSVSFHPTALRAASRPRRLLWEQFRLPALLDSLSPDVVWHPGNACPVLRLPRAPQAVTIHDLQYLRFPSDFTPAALLAMRLLTSATMRRATAIVAVSDFTRSELLSVGVPPARVRVATEGVSPEFFPAADAPLPPPPPPVAAIAAPYLLTVAHSYPHKDLPVAVLAFARYLDFTPSAPHHLVLLGKPRQGEPALQKALASLPPPVRARVHRFDSLPFADLPALYRNAAAFLFPSRYEGFGLPVLEAMASRTPVLAAPCASVPEVAGDAAHFAEPGNPDAFASALSGLLSLSPASRAALLDRASARAASFTWTASANALLDALQATADLRNPARKEPA